MLDVISFMKREETLDRAKRSGHPDKMSLFFTFCNSNRFKDTQYFLLLLLNFKEFYTCKGKKKKKSWISENVIKTKSMPL